MSVMLTDKNALNCSARGRYPRGSGERPNRRSAKSRFSNKYYVYDIESTKYEPNDAPIMGYSYLHGIKGYEFNCDMNKDNINNYTDGYVAIRTNGDMENFFYELNKSAIRTNEKILILVHNLTYEFYNAIFNMPKLNALLEQDNKNIFALSSTKICKIQCGNLEFRDSLLLFGKSLKKCAIEVGMKKNEEHKTYNEIWTEKSDLPKWEYDYNEHDLDLVAVYFSKFVKMLNLDTDYVEIQDFINTNILTITGMVRFVCKKLNSKENLDKQMFMVQKTQNSIDEKTQKWIENSVFRGGFCKSVPINTFCINKDVHSIDFASAYPAVMVTGLYPAGELVDSNGAVYELDCITKNVSTEKLCDSLWNTYFSGGLYYPYKHILFKVRVTNLKIKRFDNKNEIGYLPIAKCEDYENATIYNGSVYKADSIVFSGTEYDYIVMRLFYNFDLDEILIEKSATEKTPMYAYKILNISKFAKEKEGFKKLSKITDYDEFCNKLNSELVDGITFGEIFGITGEVATKTNMKHIQSVCNDYLMSAKNRLNSQYGISVQHQFQQDIIYKNYQFEVCEEERLNWSKYENYLQGIYVTAINRFRLLLMTAKLITSGFDVVYFDTDSIKVKGDINELNTILSDWNSMMEVLRERTISKYKNEHLYFSNFGNFDYEGTYKYFMTQGSKRYISIDYDDTVHCTISGVNKIANSSGATLFYKRFGINELFRQWFGLNTLFDYTLSRRSINHIPTEPTLINVMVTDDNGKECQVKQYSCEGISEKDCGYLLSGFFKPINAITWFYFYCYNLRGDKIQVEYKPHTIICNNVITDEDGNIIDCEFDVKSGFTIDKYDENLRTKWNKYFKNKKLMDYNDGIYESLHDYRNGVIINS